MAEWLKAADCKSARIAYVGSNPTPTTISTRPVLTGNAAKAVKRDRLHVRDEG